MTVLVAVSDRAEGKTALAAGISEAQFLGTDLLVMNLSLSPFPPVEAPDGVGVEVLERSGRGDRDPVDAVLDEIRERPDVQRLVIAPRRRSRVGKVLLGSVSQRLILESPVPVLTAPTLGRQD